MLYSIIKVNPNKPTTTKAYEYHASGHKILRNIYLFYASSSPGI